MKKSTIVLMFLLMIISGYSQSKNEDKILEATKSGFINDENNLNAKELYFKVSNGYKIIEGVKSKANLLPISAIKNKVTGESLTDEKLLSTNFNILMYEIPFNGELFLSFRTMDNQKTLLVYSDQRIKTLVKRNNSSKNQNK